MDCSSRQCTVPETMEFPHPAWIELSITRVGERGGRWPRRACASCAADQDARKYIPDDPLFIVPTGDATLELPVNGLRVYPADKESTP